jgi:dipeptidyl aminopeptidase/acylaminoacyl peptidase
MPVVGDPETMNDTFVEQIVGAAKAAIDELAQRGVIDPNRVLVGGHSYGAFMTANLLAHAPGMFAAGIARSGAYNRTLTPFGFQSERRSFWEATDIYIKLSPFTYTNQIKEPILLIHGQEDNNPGTFTMQSERFFQALQANGATARLVLLPHESHGYRSRQSVLHTLAEMIDWANKYVKNKS